MSTLFESADSAQPPPGERVFVALGSNLEQPDLQLERGLQLMMQQPGIELSACSALYTTSPMGPSDQPDFINAVCELRSSLQPEPLLDSLQAVEADCGRLRDGTRWGPRTLDLDILLYGQSIIETSRLTVPHPGLLLRSFVLIPLLEVSPMICIPGRGAACDFLDTVENFGIRQLREINLPARGSHALE